MLLKFRQGIVHSNPNNFLVNPASVTLQVTSMPLDVTMANKTNNYYHVEAKTVLNAWITPNNNPNTVYLYIDLDTLNAVRTFGVATQDQIISPTVPLVVPITLLPIPDGQHWFDTTNNVMKVYLALTNIWIEKIRIFVATYTNGAPPVLYTPNNQSQISLITTESYQTGRVLYDSLGTALRTSDGSFITSETDFYTYGGISNSVRMESDITLVKASQPIPAFSVVAITGYGDDGIYPFIELADYTNVNETLIAICTEDLDIDDITAITTRGVITNVLWDWQTAGIPVGRRLWIGTGPEAGTLVPIDPFIGNNSLTKKPAVAKILSTNSIIFQQSFEDVGATGSQGLQGTSAYPATVAAIGSSKLSVTSLTPLTPVVVGDNDPRMTNSRTPTYHVHDASQISVSGFGAYVSSDLQVMLQAIDAAKLNLTGGTLTGFLTLNANPTTNLQAAPKQYVDTSITTNNNLVVLKAGSTMTGYLNLNADPVTNLQAATKQYVDNSITTNNNLVVLKAGSTMTGFLTLSADPVSNLQAATKQYVDNINEKWLYTNVNTLVANKSKHSVDTSGSSKTITLPNTATFGHVVWIADHVGTFDVNNLILDGNGLNIMGSNALFTVNVKDLLFVMLYVDLTTGWKIYPLGD